MSSIFTGRGSDNSQPDRTTEERPPQTRPEILPEHLGLRSVYQSDRSNIDIIAVHGIGADPAYTWKTSGRNGVKVDWLKDSTMLPNAVPQARIMTFGYQSQWFGKNAVTTKVSGIAKDLMMSLESCRKSCVDRPIIFIGHCFGGLIIEKALTLAKLHDSSILPSTKGIIFLGTPHRGTGEITSSELMYKAIASAPSLLIDSTALRSIERGSEILSNIYSEFMIVSKRSKFRICCFYERRVTDVGVIIGQDGLTEFMVDEDSSFIPGHDSRGLGLDHFRMSKFTGPEDGDYHAVRDEILKLDETTVPQKQPEQPRHEDNNLRSNSLHQGGSTFSGNNTGRHINQVGNVGGDFSSKATE